MKSWFCYSAVFLFGVSPASSDEQRIDQWLKADKNKDRKLAEAETSGLMKRFFGRNDSNQDGFLDQSELTDLDNRLKKRGGNPKSRTTIPDSVHFAADVAYREGNKMWKLDLAYPKEKSETLRPGIVIIHGGGWRSGDKGGSSTAVIGVAKSFFFEGDNVIEVNRGGSSRPLYVTAVGIDPGEAATRVSSMSGDYRVPATLKRADSLCRGHCECGSPGNPGN